MISQAPQSGNGPLKAEESRPWFADMASKGATPATPNEPGEGDDYTHKRSWLAHLRLRRRIGTAARLALLHTVVVTAVLLVVVLQFIRAYSNYYHSTIRRDLGEEVVEFSNAASARAPNQSFEVFVHDYLETHVLRAGSTLIIRLPNGTTLGSGNALEVLKNADVRQLLAHPSKHTITRQVGTADAAREILVTPIFQANKPSGTFLTAASLNNLEAERERFLTLAVGEALITLFAGVVSVYMLLRRLLRTVGRVTQTAENIAAEGDLHRRLGDQGTDDEVGRLAATFDAMIATIEATMAAQQRLLSDISHQLRTPLTIARGYLEVLDRGGRSDPIEVSETVAVVVEELDHMQSLVERLLFLGHALEPDFFQPEPVDLRALLFDAVDAAKVLAERNWSIGEVPDLVVWADSNKLRGAILNLFDNSIHATTSTDTIKVGAQWPCPVDCGDTNVLRIFVDDSGPGIPKEQRESALARFARPGAKDSRGTGLGLSIVRAVAEGHRGTISLSDSPLGGLRVIFELPSSSIRDDSVRESR